MTKTLLITDTDTAWDLLGEMAGLYGDNGSDPDGNAWLPSAPFVNDDVVRAGAGKIADAVYFDSDEAVAKYTRTQGVLALAEEADDWEAFKNAVDEWCARNGRVWAHYNAYGTMSSNWVIAKH